MNEPKLIAPHGGQLINRQIAAPTEEELTGLHQIEINLRAVSDLELIANGAFSPLEGFMDAANYRRVVEEMHLANGLAWSLPITLSVSKEKADTLVEGEKIILSYKKRPVALFYLTEKYSYNKELEAQKVYRTRRSPSRS